MDLDYAALFGFPGRISVRREVPDAAVDDEGIALAIAEEANAADGRLAADRKLREKSNKADYATYEGRGIVSACEERTPILCMFVQGAC